MRVKSNPRPTTPFGTDLQTPRVTFVKTVHLSSYSLLRRRIYKRQLRIIMSFPTPKFSKTCPTYAPRRRAPRPIVIPLYATPITRIPSPPLPVHRTLAAKVRFHPYAEARRSRPNDRPPPIPIPAAVNTSTTSPPAAEPASTDTVPDSPLTPIDPSQPETSRAETVKIRPPQIMSVSNAGWHEAQQAEYRVCCLLAFFPNADPFH
jgi:hypothetical protein